MTKKILSFLTSLLICLLIVFPAFGVNGCKHIYDNSGSISSKTLNELEKKADKTEKKYNFFVMYELTESIDGFDNTYDYAQSVYTERVGSQDGIILVHNLADAKYVFYTCGIAAGKIFTDDVQSVVGNDYNDADSYYDGINAYLEDTAKYLSFVNNTGDATVSSLIPKDRQKPLVVDEADVLSPQEENALLEKLEDYSQTLKCEIAIVAVNSTQGKTAQEFADDFYDYNGYGYGDNDDGMLFLISMSDRKWAVSTFGEAYNRMYVDDINGMVSAAKKYLSANRFADAFDVIADKAFTILSEGGSAYGNGDGYSASSEDGLIHKNGEKSTVSWIWIPIDIVIGFIIAFIIVKVQSSSLKSVRSQADADNYVVPGSVVITHNSDHFLYKNVSRTKRVEESSSGGSGGSHGGHISSSGRTHGGSSGSF